jgi:hypothetical protein
MQDSSANAKDIVMIFSFSFQGLMPRRMAITAFRSDTVADALDQEWMCHFWRIAEKAAVTPVLGPVSAAR